MKNRLGIYFFYDSQGIVDDFVIYYLVNLKKFCKELCVVVNEPLQEQGRIKLEQVCDKLLVRENKGFDSQAYKYAMKFYGYDELKKYDELILCNFTCYGPVYPFEEMFEKMEKSNCDYWGMSWYPKAEGIIACSEQTTSYIPEHIMSFFMTIRNKMLSSNAFRDYWENIKIPNNYGEAVFYNELQFTNYFTKHGFIGDTFIPKEVTKRFYENIYAFAPNYTMEYRSPLVKRNAFKAPSNLYTHYGRGNQPRDLMKFLKENTTFDTNLIWDDLLRTQKGSLIKRNLHLNYFLDEKYFNGDENILKENLKTAMLLYSYYDDMGEYALSYAKNLPSWVDIYIYVVNENTKKIYEKIFSALPNKTKVIIKENRGQLASAVLVSGKDIFENYDLVCVTQTKKSTQLRDKFASENFCNHCWEGVLKSRPYVLNVIKTFYENPRMGYSCNIPPHCGNFEGLIGSEVENNEENMKEIMKKFNLQAPFDDEPIASYGECYWVRAKGFKKLLEYNWSHQDFPLAKETPKDGCILNALERLMPIFVQEEGYYPAWVAPNSNAEVYFDNIYHQLRNFMVSKKNKLKKITHALFIKRRFYKILSHITFGKWKNCCIRKVNKYNSYLKY